MPERKPKTGWPGVKEALRDPDVLVAGALVAACTVFNSPSNLGEATGIALTSVIFTGALLYNKKGRVNREDFQDMK